jgi:hypothetical protein
MLNWWVHWFVINPVGNPIILIADAFGLECACIAFSVLNLTLQFCGMNNLLVLWTLT